MPKRTQRTRRAKQRDLYLAAGQAAAILMLTTKEAAERLDQIDSPDREDAQLALTMAEAAFQFTANWHNLGWLLGVHDRPIPEDLINGFAAEGITLLPGQSGHPGKS